MAALHPLPLLATRKTIETQPKRSRKRRIVGWSLGLILFVACAGAGAAYALGYFDPNPEVVAVKQQIQAKLDDHAALEKADNNARFDFIKDIGSKLRSLPAEVRKPLGEQLQKMAEQHMKDVLAMPPDQQTAALDKDIDLWQMMMKEQEKRRAERDAAKPSGTPKGAPGDAKPAATASGAGGPSDAGGSPRPQLSHNQMLSSTTGETRASGHHYIELLHTRAVERGISVPSTGGRQ